MNLDKLTELLQASPSFRIKQINKLIYQDFISSWQEASVLPKDLRAKLEDSCSLQINAQEVVLKDASVKAVITLEDKQKVEAVLIKNLNKRNTVCVSSQIGCALGCKFCATGQMGFIRNLSAKEIVEQVLYFARKLKEKNEKVDNIVFMGMGEPFLNIDNVFRAIEMLNSEDKFNIGARKISISTVGIRKGIEKMIKSKLQVNLAVSLHAPNDKLRSHLMPINKKQSIKELLELVDSYIELTGRQVMFEYVVIKGVNDSIKLANELADILNKKLYMLNLIRYNDSGVFKSSEEKQIQNFKRVLEKRGIRTTLRSSFGNEGQAACGQLAVKR
ncbi:MAG: 23S rRNA (adenine(2503)-C(2))-methyltransferase RlmN [Parcubacteria group bacterium]